MSTFTPEQQEKLWEAVRPNDTQRKAVKKLEIALKSCAAAEVVFWNMNGRLYAFNGEVVDSVSFLDEGRCFCAVRDLPLREAVSQHGYDFESFADDEVMLGIIMHIEPE